MALPTGLPEIGVGTHEALRRLAPQILGRARQLGAPHSLAHMDPPTPWITWAVTQWTASVNQNLLHPDTSPSAREIERQVVQWLCPFFGMDGGHMTPGSTLANITAIWAARECRHIQHVVASTAAHLSIKKAAHLLGLGFHAVPIDDHGRLQTAKLPSDLSKSCLVLTAGTTNSGAIDPLAHRHGAAWVHVDAAWAGPMMLSERKRAVLAGIEQADSIAMSAHKWLFQPKESALIFFRDTATAHEAITFGGAYLAAPNVGMLGSHGANAAPLMATLLAWGRQGMADRIERCIACADRLTAFIASRPDLLLYSPPESAVVLWRTQATSRMDSIWERLPRGSTSQTWINEIRWFRNVAANPNADVETLISAIEELLG
jgi:L-2,4-diaminobutyrate decarboxylase